MKEWRVGYGHDSTVHAVDVLVEEMRPGDEPETIFVDFDVRASVAGRRILALELDDPGRWGAPFDDAAAARAVAYARERITFQP